MQWAIALSAACLLAGCAAAPRSMPDICLLPPQRPAVAAKLYFGDGIEGRAPLTEPEWARFVSDVVTPAFPDGFTTYRAQGQWRSAATGKIGREATHVIEIVAAPGPDLGARLDRVVKTYRSQFRQDSVGIVTEAVCAAF